MNYELRVQKRSKRREDNESDGFTLIELLVTISIIGILIGLSVFGLQGARQSARDAKRKTDLEQIRSAVEIYKADCNKYPLTLGAQLKGDGLSTSSCLDTNIYLSEVPFDPTSPNSDYKYYSLDGSTYELCAALEQGGATTSCGVVAATSCGAATCNYKVTNP
ncbi:MAG: prepilin-type N-terminal cleavage/methylation domain-containing protein [Candidatus Woesebacteria bacterium]|nr:MAG: prepilin-type N-terminal cleavage/methylation domain-containing protein [Candidatus Woesebacteria bacterium]